MNDFVVGIIVIYACIVTIWVIKFYIDIKYLKLKIRLAEFDKYIIEKYIRKGS